MKHLLIISFVVLPILAVSQDYLMEFDRFNSRYNFEWRGFESDDKFETKNAFIEFVEKHNMLEYERQVLNLIDSKLKNSIRAVDINNDLQTDIIYQGPSGGEGSVVHIFVQTNSEFNCVFTTKQGIVKVIWEGELLDKLFVHDWGCCGVQTLTNSVYQINYLDNIPEFKLSWQSIELKNFLSKPKLYFETPKRFEIVNEKYKLRVNPLIDNTTKNYILDITGNTIGILKKGYKGTAYASSEDKTGRIWWYVLIDNEYELEDTFINYSFYEFKPGLIGWISSRYVAEL